VCQSVAAGKAVYPDVVVAFCSAFDDFVFAQEMLVWGMVPLSCIDRWPSDL
jgi:hypothetical protein